MLSPTASSPETVPEIRTESGKAVSPFHAGLSEPVVRKIIDVFDGRLVDVTPGARKNPPA
ncbi:MAG: hypothetical protein GX629_12020 [Phycisphaerae bacterium]|nr:hypothetical protein [Phycisphaerae bacterium]